MISNRMRNVFASFVVLGTVSCSLLVSAALQSNEPYYVEVVSRPKGCAKSSTTAIDTS